MPIARELTEVFLDIFNRKNTRRLVEKMAAHQPYGENRPINKTAITEVFDVLLAYKERNGKNYEEILATLQAMGEDYSKSQSDKDSYHYAFGMFYELIHALLSLYQSESYKTLYKKNFQWFSKFANILSAEETWVFSLNHDLFLESLAIDLGIPVTYGATGSLAFPISNMEMDERIEFSTMDRSAYHVSHPSFFAGKTGLNLVKLHGGLSEHEYKDHGLLCNQVLHKASSNDLMADFLKILRMAYYDRGQKIPDGKDRVITDANGELDILGKAMLTGGRKYSKTADRKKGEEKLIIFDEVLAQIDELTVIGYSFGDKHVNFRINNAMARKDNLSVRIIDPNFKELPEFLQTFDYNSRIKRASCGAAHWFDYCKSQKWDAEQSSALKANSQFRLAIKKQVESIVQAGQLNSWY